MAVTEPAAGVPEAGRRLLVYALWDRRGGTDDYVLYALEGMRQEVDGVVVVVNGSLSDDARTRIGAVADDIIVRMDDGGDIQAYKAALDHLGTRVADFDEILFTDDTWFGPIRPFRPVLQRMAAIAVHFWALFDVPAEDPMRSEVAGIPDRHLESPWIAVRREMFLSDEWSAFWRDLPAASDGGDAHAHIAGWTQHFVARGFLHEVAFPAAHYPTDNPALFNSDLLLADGCPLIARGPFVHFPPFLDRHAVIGREIVHAVESSGYPMAQFWQNLARNVEPKVLNADAGMLEVLPDVDVSYDPARPLRVVAILHIHYTDMTDEMLDRVDTLPGPYDLVITTADARRAAQIREIVERRPREGRAVEIRVVDSNDGRDQSAFLIGCRDILLGDAYDLVVKLHSKKTPQDGFNIGRHFKAQQFRNLLDSPGYTANLLALFQKESGLGLVYPPMIHIGYPTMGRAWWANKAGARRLCEELGIRVPLDDISPLAPFGSMFIARPAALRLLAEHPWKWAQFGGPEAYRDGGFAHILERLPSYAAGELGYHTRTVATTEYMSISHTALEYKMDQLSTTFPSDSLDAITFMRTADGFGRGGLTDFLRAYLRLHHPGAGAALRRVVGRDTWLGRLLRSPRQPRA